MSASDIENSAQAAGVPGVDARTLLIVIYAVLQTTLACLVLPLWEGYDEAYHFSYAQHLFEHGALPRLGQTGLSTEVWRSLKLVPTTFRNAHDEGRLLYSDYFK
ncbi:MAG TPA: hypothetical protein VGP79_17195, partial [Bryobacteraceae bacterium]|nr:hypothetical protein [Bryobacteraceae bacterium]